MSQGRHRRGYVTQGDDIVEAVTKDITLGSLKYQDFEVTNVQQVKGNLNFCEMAIVETTHGNYFVQCFKDDAGRIYNQVSRYL